VFARGAKAIFKANGSWGGDGIRIVTPEGFSGDTAWPDGVFQNFIESDPQLRRFYAGATATLRLTTAIGADGRAALRAAYLRLGRGRDLYVQSASVVRVSLDLATGEFGREGLCADWSRVEAHPDTGERFSGSLMPGFAAARAMVLSCHERFPLVGCVGWDIAVDGRQQPWLLEWNAMHNDIKFSEATVGPCFRGLQWEPLWKTPLPAA
jgi:hypothetical protein